MNQARRKPRGASRETRASKAAEPAASFNPLAALWRLFFAVDQRPPRNFFERRRRRFRASFFFILGIAATLTAQAFLGSRR